MVVSISQRSEELRLQPGSEFDKFKTRLRSRIFKCISWLNGSFLGGYDRSFVKEGVKTYLIKLI
jgi:hypothetical protein